MKGRLSQATLATMKVALARQETFAEKPLGALERAPFHKALIISDQNVLDVVRVIEEVNILRAESEIDYVAMRARSLLQVGERVTAKRPEIAADQLTFRAGGTLGDCHLFAPFPTTRFARGKAHTVFFHRLTIPSNSLAEHLYGQGRALCPSCFTNA